MITAAFDVDGCLLLPAGHHGYPVANEPVRTMLVMLSFLPNVRIHVWSGSGELYARQVAAELGLRPYVTSYSSKTDASVQPDLTFDDEEMTRGKVNIRIPQEALVAAPPGSGRARRRVLPGAGQEAAEEP